MAKLLAENSIQKNIVAERCIKGGVVYTVEFNTQTKWTEFSVFKKSTVYDVGAIFCENEKVAGDFFDNWKKSGFKSLNLG